MTVKYLAVKDKLAMDLVDAMDTLGIKYDYFGHDETWSVIAIIGGLDCTNLSVRDTYEGALLSVGVVEC